MPSPATLPESPPLSARDRLIAATQAVMLRSGYAATTVDQICTEAGLTKGGFFHHFAGKEAICRAAIDAWGAMGTRLYAQAWSDPTEDPLVQFNRMLDIMVALTTTRQEPCLCMVGMMSQELALTHPALRDVCAGHLADWTGHIVRMLANAQRMHPPITAFDPERIGWLLNSIWQGSMLIAKTCQTPAMIVSNIELARAFVMGHFARPASAAPGPRP